MIGLGWVELARAIGGGNHVAPAPERSGGSDDPSEGEGEPFTVGDVELSDSSIDEQHEVGVTNCPQELGVVTLDNGADGERRVIWTAAPNILINPPSSVLLADE